MANERLAQARAQIKAKQYQQARRTLTGVDHPTARAWLAKLDEIAPEAAARPARGRRILLVGCVALLLILVAGGVLALDIAGRVQSISATIGGNVTARATYTSTPRELATQRLIPTDTAAPTATPRAGSSQHQGA